MDNKVVECARQYIGVPFQHQGRSTAGLDCGGLVVVAYRDAGIEVADVKGYSRYPGGGSLQRVLGRSFHLVSKPHPGDVLLMAFGREPEHLAIYAGRTIIHSYERVMKVVEHRFALVWQARVRGVYRV